MSTFESTDLEAFPEQNYLVAKKGWCLAELVDPHHVGWCRCAGRGSWGERRGESSIRLPTLAGAKVIHPYASHSVTPRVGEVRGRGVSFLSQVYIIGEVGGG